MISDLLNNENANYFKFSFVRNPWDRVVSLYFYLKERKEFDSDIDFKKWLSIKFNKPWLSRDISTIIRDFNLKRINGGRMGTPAELSQVGWLSDIDSNFCMDFVGRFENLQEDFNTICDKIGIPRQQLPHHNKSKHKHYTEYYNDETREIVAEKHAKDIEYFGYEFGE